MKKNPNRPGGASSFILAGPEPLGVKSCRVQKSGQLSRGTRAGVTPPELGQPCPGDLCSSNKKEARESDPRLSSGRGHFLCTHLYKQRSFGTMGCFLSPRQTGPLPRGSQSYLWLRTVFSQLRGLPVCNREIVSSSHVGGGSGRLGAPHKL